MRSDADVMREMELWSKFRKRHEARDYFRMDAAGIMAGFRCAMTAPNPKSREVLIDAIDSAWDAVRFNWEVWQGYIDA